MLKVVIADDEEHICRLIHALADWEAMEMEVKGFASNGLEAIELVDKWNPELLITDIRMPGCDGMELIKHVKTSNPIIEVVIISGHAHFPYAQTAMKYGVSNYLLKPINKVELNQTLLKLGEKIRERQSSESGLQELIEQTQNTKQQMKSNLIPHLLDGTLTDPTAAMLKEGCGLEIQDETIQVFCLKLDYDERQLNEDAIILVQEKINDIIQANLRKLCTEMVFHMKESFGYGILFYEYKRKDDIRRVMRDCLNQFIMQRSVYGPVHFTLSMSESSKDVSALPDLLKHSTILVHERLLTNTDRVIEALPKEAGRIDEKVLERYSRISLQALEMLSVEEAGRAVENLRREVLGVKHPCGVDVLELVLSAGSTLLIQVNYKNQKEANEVFREKCLLCGTMEELFATLLELETNIIQEMEKERESEVLRPIRLAKQYIRNHYNEQITLEEVSDVIGLSTSYFSALFKKETGEGFAKYLIGIRIDEAKRLLRESNLSVAIICKTVGYNDSKHFTHTFEKATGLKPSAYRKLYG